MKIFNEWFFALQVKDIVSLAAWLLGGLSILIEFNRKIPFHPLSNAVRWMGNILNREILTKLDDIERATQTNSQAIDSVRNDMESRFDAYDRQEKERQAVDMRSEIVNFAENLKLGRIYSDKQFEYILGVISKYYEHCEKYSIKNHYIDEAHSFIRSEVRKQFETKKGQRNEK